MTEIRTLPPLPTSNSIWRAPPCASTMLTVNTMNTEDIGEFVLLFLVLLLVAFLWFGIRL